MGITKKTLQLLIGVLCCDTRALVFVLWRVENRYCLYALCFTRGYRANIRIETRVGSSVEIAPRIIVSRDHFLRTIINIGHD